MLGMHTARYWTKNSSAALTIGLMALTARTRSMQEFGIQVFEAFSAPRSFT
jgi:hypothetical protein